MQLSPPLVLVIGLAIGCSGGTEARGRTGYRYFNDATVRVSSPRADASVVLGEAVEISPYWTADVISAATPLMSAPDAVTRATEYSETRHEGGAGVTWQPSPLSNLSASYRFSVEPDYISHTTGVTATQELFDRNSTLAAGALLSFDEVGSADNASFEEDLTTVSANLGWSQVFSPELLAQLSYSLEFRDGYQANPYRLVPIFSDGGLRPRFTLPERTPDRRTRQALEATGIWSMARTLYLHAGYRFYFDDWGIDSHTGRISLWQTLDDDRFRLRYRARAYAQRGADFYRERYTDVGGFRSGDFRLSTMTTFSGGLRLDLRFPDVIGEGWLVGTISYDLALFLFDDYAVRDSMLAHLVGVALTLEYEWVP